MTSSKRMTSSSNVSIESLRSKRCGIMSVYTSYKHLKVSHFINEVPRTILLQPYQRPFGVSNQLFQIADSLSCSLWLCAQSLTASVVAVHLLLMQYGIKTRHSINLLMVVLDQQRRECTNSELERLCSWEWSRADDVGKQNASSRRITKLNAISQQRNSWNLHLHLPFSSQISCSVTIHKLNISSDKHTVCMT